jgi:predicted DNA-binding ribbon-helix-helix protein
MKSPVVKRSVLIENLKTSISIEDAFWRGLKEAAAEDSMRLGDLIAMIRRNRTHDVNLSSAIRVYVLERVKAKAESVGRIVPAPVPVVAEL